MQWLATIVCVVHLAFLAFATLAPFSSDPAVLALYVLTIPFLWVHWACNDDTCALTLLERKLRGLEGNDESFVHRIVSPVYKIRDEHASQVAWVASVGLWLVAFARARRLRVWAHVFPTLA